MKVMLFTCIVQSLFVLRPSFLVIQCSESRAEWTSATMPLGPMPIDSIRPLNGVVEIGAAGGRTIVTMCRAVAGGLP